MKKRILAMLLVLAMVCTLALAFTSCNDGDATEPNENFSGVEDGGSNGTVGETGSIEVETDPSKTESDDNFIKG